LEAAARAYDRALAALAHVNADRSAFAAVYHNLAGLAFLKGQYEVAESFGRRALEERQSDERARCIDVAREEAALAPILSARGKATEARSLLEGALVVFRETVGVNHVEVAFVLGELAALDIQDGRLHEAGSALKWALAVKERALGAAHPSLVPTLHNCAAVLLDSGQRAEAVHYVDRALAILAARTATEHPWRSQCESLRREAHAACRVEACR
jgi:tetratricopeptide (TPR) repeat protein